MPKYLITFSRDDLRRIQRLVEAGEYSGLDEIVSVALRNQLVAEEEGIDPWTARDGLGLLSESETHVPPQSTNRSRQRDTVAPPLEWDFATPLGATAPAILPDPRDDQLAGTLFWAQYYRFLPLKVAILVLYKLATDRPVPLVDYVRTVTAVGTRMHRILRQLDTDLELSPGERLSTSFPIASQKSQTRFGDQFLIARRPRSGLLDGFLARSKFANLVELDGELRVALTQDGAEFAMIPNPVLVDQRRPARSLAREEVEFLVNHLHKKVPGEYSHMIAFLDALAGGADGREALDTAMRSFYRSVLEGADRMTEGHVSSMRAGVQSRLQEMSFVESRREGTKAVCRITDVGMDLLRHGPLTRADSERHDDGEGSLRIK